jgi:DNA adenine methylase
MPPKQPRRRAPLETGETNRLPPLAPKSRGPRPARPSASTLSKTSKVSPTLSPKASKTLPARPRQRPVAAATTDDDPRVAKPFVKWAGGKRQLLDEISRRMPPKFGNYHEPFVGGGAVFFALAAGKKAYLSDSNERLVRCYKGIRDNVDEVIARLKGYRKTRDEFMKVRAVDIDSAPGDAEVAAWFIYVNKLGFNGLYRVNSKNKFNVPYGANEHKEIYDERNLRACARALAHAHIEREDFSEVRHRAKPGDLVYFDPPYIPLSATSSFTSYTAGGFTSADQVALRDLARELKELRVHVVLSNSPPAAALYSKELGFEVQEVLALRVVNSNAALRGKITELLIT